MESRRFTQVNLLDSVGQGQHAIVYLQSEPRVLFSLA